MARSETTTRERIQCMYEHREADRVPIVDSPCASSIARWERKGMSAHADWTEYLGADRVQMIGTDNSPCFPTQMIDATDE